MMFSWIFFLAIVIWGIWYFGKSEGGFPKSKTIDSPIDTLKSRFAKGEITEEEYEERRAVLEEDEYLNTNP